MKQMLREKGLLFSVFLLFYLIIEITMFKWMSFSLLPKNLFMDLLVVFSLSSVIFLIKSNKWTIVYLSFIYGIAVTLFLINATMYSVYFDVFTLQQLQLLGEARDVFNFEYLSISSIIAATIISLIYLFVMIKTYKHLRIKHINMGHYYRYASFTFVCLFVVIFTLFSSNLTQVVEYSSETNVTTFKRAKLKEFGMMGYYSKEAENMLQKENEAETINSEDAFQVVESEPTDYYGLLKGMNVITIMMESAQPFAINETLTPNIYRLETEGLSFPNNYSENKTNVSEMVSITGNYPTINMFPDSHEYDFSFSIPNRLKDTYDTSYYHDNVESFYDRGNLMPQLGFERTYFHYDLKPGEPMYSWSGNYPLDSDTMDKILPYLIGSEEPFYAYWCTLSTHGPYYYGKENIQLFIDKGYWGKVLQAEKSGDWVNPAADSTDLNINRIRFYEAAMMDMDVAIGKLIDALIENDLLHNTLIVMYGDHDVYYHDLQLTINHTTKDQYYRMDMYDTFMCMYNPLLNATFRENNQTDSGEIDKFVTPYSIAPTILDLLGMDYNTNLYLGSSVFSDKDDVFYSNKLAGLFNQYFYSDDGQSIVYQTEVATDAEKQLFFQSCQEITQKLDYINRWYNDTSVVK